MAEFKDRIPVLNDIVDHGEKVPCSTDRVPDSETFDALVENLQREMFDRVTRALHELMVREEAGMRSAIRAHLEVMLPEIMERWQQECREGNREGDKVSEQRVPVANPFADSPVANPFAEPSEPSTHSNPFAEPSTPSATFANPLDQGYPGAMEPMIAFPPLHRELDHKTARKKPAKLRS